MADPKKAPQMSLDDYLKVKDKRAKKQLQLNFPLFIKLAAIIPITYGLFLISYYLLHIRFLPEH